MVTHGSMTTLFGTSLMGLINLNSSQILLILIVELVGIGLVSATVGNIFLDTLLKKI